MIKSNNKYDLDYLGIILFINILQTTFMSSNTQNNNNIELLKFGPGQIYITDSTKF